MIKKKLLVALCAAVFAGATLLTSCGGTGSFLPEYEIRSGESIAIPGGVTYELVGAPEGVAIDPKTGVITFDAAPYTQVLAVAKKSGKVVSETKVTLLGEFKAPTLRFTNLSDNIVSGDSVSAVSDTGSAVTYALKGDTAGVEVGRTTGKVTFASFVADGTPFIVEASSRGVSLEHTFKAAAANFVRAEADKQFVSQETPCDIGFRLEFGSDASVERQGVLGVQSGHTAIDSSLYDYDAGTRLLRLKKEVFADWSAGEHALRIITAKNAVSVTVSVATKFISTPEALASINASAEALSGYYVMTRDIDLAAYCEKQKDDGYWTPIGTYHDVADGTALNDAFKGTFDGNGHRITGFKIYRDQTSDTRAYNAGLFGYVDNTATIVNLGLESSAYNVVRSFSGTFVGVNTGVIENCYVQADVESIGNYVGGFVGRNEGTIKSAYTLGTVRGETSKGSFAGRNMGVLENCYAVTGEKGLPLVGTDEGRTVGENFATRAEFEAFDFPFGEPWVLGKGAPALKEAVPAYFLNGVALTGLPASMYKGTSVQLTAVINPPDASDAGEPSFASSVGTIENDTLYVPVSADASACVVTVTCGDYSDSAEIALLEPRLEISGGAEVLVKSYSYDLEVSVLPALSEYISAVKYEITEGKGVTVSEDGRITVSRNSKAETCTVRAYIEGIAEAYKTFMIRDVATGVSFLEDTDDVVHAGHRYRLSAAVSPATADQAVTYTVSGLSGVSILGDLLIVSDAAASGTIAVTAHAGTSAAPVTAVKNIEVVGKTAFDGNVKRVAEGESATFDLSAAGLTSLEGLVVRRMEKKIDAAVNGTAVTIGAEYLEGFGSRPIEITFWINGKVYVATVTVSASDNI